METDIVAAIDDVAVDDVENTADTSALNAQAPSIIEEKFVKKVVGSRISAGDQNQQTEDDEIDLDKVAKVVEISTQAPQNNGDGGNLSVEMRQHSEDHVNPGHSNVSMKRRRDVHISIFVKREILPRKSKTKAYEYLKNITRGIPVASNAGDRRRVQRKRLIRNVRGNKSSLSRKRNGERRPPVRRLKVGIRRSGTTISSVSTDVTGSSGASSHYNARLI